MYEGGVIHLKYVTLKSVRGISVIAVGVAQLADGHTLGVFAFTIGRIPVRT